MIYKLMPKSLVWLSFLIRILFNKMAKRKSNISLSDVLLEVGFDEDGNAI